MERKNFLKILGASGGSLLLGGFNITDQGHAYEMRETKIYDNYIRGANFYRDDYFKLKLTIGEPVNLIREQDNVYDSFAIQVWIKGKQLGYLAAYENIVLANLMDAGVQLNASLSHIKPFSKNEYLRDVVAIRVTAKLLVPIVETLSPKNTNLPADDQVDVYRQGYESKVEFKEDKNI